MLIAYLCPALMDWLTFFASFAIFYRAGEIGLPASQTVALAALFQAAYLITCLPLGYVLNRRTARPLVIIGTIGSTIAGAAALLAGTFATMLATLLFLGVCASIFFNAFQTYMRSESPPGGLTRSVAAYTLAWSAGAACGQLFSGMLYKLGPLVLAPANLFIGALILVPLLMRKPNPIHNPSAEEHTEQGSASARPVNAAYVIAGWFMIFTVMFVQRPIQTFVPATSAATGISPSAAGLLLFLHMLVQAIAGFAMIKLRDWLYRRTPLIILQGGAAILLAALACTNSYWLLLAGLTLLGMYAGFVYFCAVYYAGNSGNRSLNVSFNELLVGLGSVAGLIACELWLRRFQDPRGIYLAGAIALALSVVVQTLIVSLPRKTT